MSSSSDRQSGAPAAGGLPAGQAAPIGESCPATHPIKGNRTREGELIFHSPNGRFYERTEPEVCFATEADARAAGFRPPRGASPWNPPAPAAAVAEAGAVPVVDAFARIQRFNLPQGFVELAERLAERIAPIIKRQPGCRSVTLLCDETSGEYIFLTHWDTLEQINAFERSADEWRVRDIMSEHVTAVPQIEVYQVHNVPQHAGVAAG